MALPFVPFISKLDAPLLKLDRLSDFNLDSATKGVHVFGGIGSGKTSGSGKMLAGAYLRAGMGGLVTAVKPDEIALFKRYCAEHGRSDSLILFDENEGFNFLNYELARQGMEGIGSVTECFMRILEAAKKVSPTGGKGGDSDFFESTTRMTLCYTIAPNYAAYGRVTIDNLIRSISSAPKSRADVTSREWQQGSFLFRTLQAASNAPKVRMATPDLKNAIEFWSQRYVDIPDRTRGNIEISVGTVLDRFLHGRLNRVFCGKTTTIVPELSLLGGVICLCMPTLTWNEDGIIAQQLFKFLWQRCILSRNALEEKHRERPVFLWSDEAQETVSSYDFEFQSMCRGMKCCTVFLTQSLPTYYAKLGGGGENGKDAAHALVGKFGTHIYHANACPETNEYASRMIGKELTRRGTYSHGTSKSVNVGMNAGSSENHGSSDSFGSSYGQGASANNSSGTTSGTGSSWGETKGRGTSNSESRGYSEAMENVIEPGDFARSLMTGGPENNGVVTGIWFESGRRFGTTGKNVLLGRFEQ